MSPTEHHPANKKYRPSARHESHIRLDPSKLLREIQLRGLTTAEFGARAEVSAPTLSRIVNGRPAKPSTVTRITEALARVPVIEGLDLLLEERA